MNSNFKTKTASGAEVDPGGPWFSWTGHPKGETSAPDDTQSFTTAIVANEGLVSISSSTNK